MMDELDTSALLEVLAEREAVGDKYAPDILSDAFPQQKNFILDPASLKALFCTRRAAKSFTGGLYLIQEASRHPGVSCLYIALTRDSAKKIMWKDVLKTINRKYSLGIKFNETNLTATLENGSVIYLTGVDADEEEKMKLLGQKYRLVVADEGSLYSIDLRELIYGVLKPAVADYRGIICIMGTSSNLTQGLFYDITRKDGEPREPGWSVHEWTAHDNPYIREQWEAELEEIRTQRPLFMQTALFKQWYLNQWVIDKNKLVYHYQAGRNDCKILPYYPRGEWQYVLGVDLGYSPDPSAFVVVGFHENDKCLYGIEAFKKTEMDITSVAEKIKSLQARYPIYKVIIDGSNKQAVEEMQKRHDVALTAADKRGKSDFIALMNDEFVQSTIKLLPHNNLELISEWEKLIWTTLAGKIVIPREEHPNLPNHLSDAFLYAWRYCYQFLAVKPTKPVNMRDPKQYVQHTEKLMEAQLERSIQRDKAQENEEDFWAIAETEGNEEDVLKHFLNKKKGR